MQLEFEVTKGVILRPGIPTEGSKDLWILRAFGPQDDEKRRSI